MYTAQPKDVKRIQDVLFENNIYVSIKKCQSIWIEYSDAHATSWMGLPQDNDNLMKILKDYVSYRVKKR